MKRILFLLSMACALSAGAQVFNNEWIDYSKTYYKFKVATTGLYRISQSSLTSIGLENINADHFQLWRNGKEVPIYTSVQSTALGATDYIEFWGEMNDGKPDNALYRQPDYQINDKWSLQTDSAAFFLTVNPSGNNLRLVQTANNVTGNTDVVINAAGTKILAAFHLKNTADRGVWLSPSGDAGSFTLLGGNVDDSPVGWKVNNSTGNWGRILMEIAPSNQD